MLLDAHGYHRLSLDQRAEVDAWLRANGIEAAETVSYEVIAEGSVVMTTVARDANGKVFAGPDGRFATTLTTITPTSPPPPHFNPKERSA